MVITRSDAEKLIRDAWDDLRIAGDEPLGRGTSGVVWRVSDGEEVEAVKVMALQTRSRINRATGTAEDARERLSREWERVTTQGERLESQWIVGINGWKLVTPDGGTKNEANAYGLIRMALFPWNLHDYVVEGFQGREGSAVALLVRVVAQALDGIWRDQEYLCTDLKPENLLVRDIEPGRPHVVVGDVGGLKGLGSLTGTTQTTPKYAAPESLRGDKTDLVATIFSFGLVAYFIVEGQLPYEDEDIPTRLRLIREGGPGFRSGLPRELAPVIATIERCLSDERAKRPQTFAEVIAGLSGPAPARSRDRTDGETVVRKPAAAAVGGGLWTPGQVFRDAPYAPEMVVIPAGKFLMGSPETEKERSSYEGPQHEVTIGRPFAVGKYAVTFDEWDACVAAGGCGGYKPRDYGWGRGRHPVIDVSWEDAQAYVKWLREVTGKGYRLLSEAEWEYACRAGTTTVFHFGDTITPAQANYDGNYSYGGGPKGEYRRRTVPVGSFPANGFGLHDMHGNVWEWVEDAWPWNYEGAPTDGSAWTTGGDPDCRVLRGGSWYYDPRDLRAAFRNWSGTGNRNNVLGFRVARTT